MSDVKIRALGSLGDGIASHTSGSIFVPFTLAGETVSVSGEPPHMDLVEIITPSSDRVEAPCPYFGTCGGCNVQHFAHAPYLGWKRGLVRDAFLQEGIETDIEPTIPSESASRRRVTFSAQRVDGKFLVGFNKSKSHDLVEIDTCAIALPAINNSLLDLRSVLPSLLRGQETISAMVTVCDNGLDLAITMEDTPNETMMASFVRAFARSSFLRASVNGDVVVEKEKPQVSFGDASVELPAGGFLQAVVSAEHAIADLVLSHLKKSKRVVDLFCGSGTFALRLAKRSRVHAVEMEPDALSALQSANTPEGTKSITTEKRDLHQLPLMGSELKPYDGICLDPPRAGAEDQIKEISKTETRKVAYVSCNPATLARDAAMLLKAGFKLDKVVPVDQFIYSHHVEVVALFSKPSAKGKRSIFAQR
jgi:23S rRNA (uracil1939-C5)-methyltransferase